MSKPAFAAQLGRGHESNRQASASRSSIRDSQLRTADVSAPGQHLPPSKTTAGGVAITNIPFLNSLEADEERSRRKTHSGRAYQDFVRAASRRAQDRQHFATQNKIWDTRIGKYETRLVELELERTKLEMSIEDIEFARSETRVAEHQISAEDDENTEEGWRRFFALEGDEPG